MATDVATQTVAQTVAAAAEKAGVDAGDGSGVVYVSGLFMDGHCTDLVAQKERFFVVWLVLFNVRVKSNPFLIYCYTNASTAWE